MWKNRNLFQKSLLSTIGMVAMSLILCCGLIVNYEYENRINERVQESEKLSEQLNNAMEEYVNGIEAIVISCYYELHREPKGSLANLLSADRELDIMEEAKVKGDVEAFFSKLFLVNSELIDIYLYSGEDGEVIYSTMANKVYGYFPEKSDWYQQVLKKNGKTYIQINNQSEYTTYNKPVFQVARMLKNVGGGNRKINDNTVISLEFSMKSFQKILDKYMLSGMSTVVFANDSGEIFYQQGAELGEFNLETLNLEKGSAVPQIRKIGNNSCCIIQSEKKLYEWNVIYIENQQYVIEKMKMYLCYIGSVLTCIAIISGILAYFIVHRMYRPIRNLKAGIQQVKKGNFDVSLQVDTNDELGMLLTEFNEMTGDIKRLIQERYEEELEKKDAQFQFLQAQIDPHFIFNTLQIISSMAIVSKNFEIEKISNSLARLIRSSINGEQKLICLADEVKNVISYLEIQRIRFKNRISYEINMKKDLESLYILKLVLQPIVENAISHGIELNEKHGFIWIHIYKENNIVYLVIKDNGKGMSETEVEKIIEYINIPFSEVKAQQKMAEHEMKARGNNVGLRNINLRLKMYYGSEYGLSIQSRIGEGTTITVCIRSENITEQN